MDRRVVAESVLSSAWEALGGDTPVYTHLPKCCSDAASVLPGNDARRLFSVTYHRSHFLPDTFGGRRGGQPMLSEEFSAWQLAVSLFWLASMFILASWNKFGGVPSSPVFRSVWGGLLFFFKWSVEFSREAFWSWGFFCCESFDDRFNLHTHWSVPIFYSWFTLGRFCVSRNLSISSGLFNFLECNCS